MNKIREILQKANIRNIMRSTSVMLVLAYLVISTFLYVDFNAKTFDIAGWLFNSSITVILHMFGLAIGNSWGKDTQKAKENGLYRKSLEMYQEIYTKIMAIIIYFDDYLIWYKEREITKAKIRFLQDNNINHTEAKNIVLYLEYGDIDKLLEAPLKLKNGSIIRVKNEEQVQAIRETYKLKVKAPTSAYFLSYSNDLKYSNELEMATMLESERKRMVKTRNIKNMFSGVLFSLIMGLVGTSFAYKQFDMVALVTLLMRVSVVFTSIYCGFNIAVDEVKMMANEIENKVNVLTAFHLCYEKGEFIPMDYEEKAIKEYEEHIKQTTQTEEIEKGALIENDKQLREI